MIRGVTGDLLSSTFLAEQAEGTRDTRRPDARWMRHVIAWHRQATRRLGPASPRRLILDVGARPLLELLDLCLADVEPHPWGHAGTLHHRSRPVATLVCPDWGASPAAAWRHALGGSLAAGLPWAMVFNGMALVVFDATRPWARHHLAFDFASLSRDETALGILHALARGVALDGGSQGPLARAVAASDAADTAVCAALGQGVLSAVTGLMQELGASAHTRPQASRALDRRAFDQSLTIVYRILFLLFAEARQLVPVWHRIYRDAYSIGTVCERLIDGGRTTGVWRTLQAMARLAHAGCNVEDLQVTAFNGRLFSPRRTPLAEHQRLSDRVAAEAVLALGTSQGPRGRRRVAFRDLGVEQLGAVYECVLDYEPVREHHALALRATSSERKTTGSFYTPRAMTDFLVRRTLAPLVRGRTADEMFSLRVLDPSMGSGAFLVAAGRFLAERIEQARVAEGTWIDGEVTDADRAQVIRAVAERCLYGIDRNQTAVHVARLSLWLMTMAGDRPLTFLDHHLAHGNSLIGARLSDLAHPPTTRGGREQPGQPGLFGDDAIAAWGRHVVPERLRLARESSDSAASVRDKERRFGSLAEASDRWSRAADLWCGLMLQGVAASPGLYDDLQRYVQGVSTALPARDLHARADQALATARRHQVAHWELLFPEVFFHEDGHAREDAGFDAVIGNPPWEVLRADIGDATQRADAREAGAAAMRFVRHSGHYRMHASGHVNQYQLFLERSLQALRHGGRFGVLVPAGLQYDVGSAGLRRSLLDRCGLDTWIGFDNRAGIFPIHRSVRFVLLAGVLGGRTDALPMLDCGADPGSLARLPDDASRTPATVPLTRVTRAFVERWDASHLTLPSLRSPTAMAVATRALDAPPLGSDRGWGVTFGRELNATDDRHHFVRIGSRTDALPVVEGKHLRPFAVNVGEAARALPSARASAILGDRCRRARVCYRDVASSTNRLTLLAAVLPADVVSTHTVFCARTPLDEDDTWCLTALLNSLVANYLVRLQMTTHVTTTLMARLPVPRPSRGSGVHGTLERVAQALAATADVEDRPDLYAHLNAVAAGLYGLSAEEYAHVVSTFPLLSAALRHACLTAWTTPSRR